MRYVHFPGDPGERRGAVMEQVSATEVGHLYLELHHRLHRLVDEAMSSAGVSLSRAKVLNELAQHGPMNQAALAARLGFAPRSVTDTVDGLEREGLAARSVDPADRRAWIVEMTEAGSTALAHALSVKKKAMNHIFGVLDATGRAEFAALLSSIRDRLDEPSGERRAH
jgi:DNA-binding MarR family transcriptional regulator